MTPWEKLGAVLNNNPRLTVRTNEPMSRHTSFRIGGPADLFIEAKSRDAAVSAITQLRANEVPTVVVGNGSNLLVSDAGVRGAVVKLANTACTRRGNTILADAGAQLSQVSSFAMREGLAGLAFAYGIPGTVGGACRMNAGAYGGEMAQVVAETIYLTPDQQLDVVLGEAHEFGYRTSVFARRPGAVILAVRMQMTPGDPAELRAEMESNAARRREKQPLEYPSAGSVFKRPPGQFAGRLIEQCGLKGARVGDAQVSEKHAGFIVNLGKATCDDVLRLIEKIQETVREQTGVSLECEICRI